MASDRNMDDSLASTYFVNRDNELMLIDDAFDSLVDSARLVRTPIVEFYGINGIGKTMMLSKIEERCNEKHLRYVRTDADQDIAEFSQSLTRQIEQKYRSQAVRSEGNWRAQPVEATKSLLQEGPVVLLIDKLDEAKENLLRLIEGILSDLAEDKNLFVVMASKRLLTFDRERSVSRKLTPFPLRPLDQENCEKYLSRFNGEFNATALDLIVRWSRGYPLAMRLMVQAIRAHHLQVEQLDDQKQLLAITINEVLNEHVLARVEERDRPLFQMILPLLAVPRRFNLIIMQELIEAFAGKPFAHTYGLTSSLAYLSLPKRINQSTGALDWNANRAGFSVDPSIRHLLLLQMSIEQPGQLQEIQRFLAERNKEYASKVSGLDQARYLQEYLYHVAQVEPQEQLAATIERIVRAIIEGPAQSFIQFSEEFARDDELKEALGTHANVALSLIHQKWAQIHKESAQESEGFDHIRNLREYLYYTLHDPQVIDPQALLKRNLERIIQNESPETSLRLLDELAREEKFREALGPELETLRAHVQDH